MTRKKLLIGSAMDNVDIASLPEWYQIIAEQLGVNILDVCNLVTYIYDNHLVDETSSDEIIKMQVIKEINKIIVSGKLEEILKDYGIFGTKGGFRWYDCEDLVMDSKGI